MVEFSRESAIELDSDAILAVVRSVLEDGKADDIVVIALRGKSVIADYFVIAGGTSSRHIGAMADKLCEAIKSFGLPPPLVDGEDTCDWVLVDIGDVVVHLFKSEVRLFYNLEKLWGG